MLLLTLHVFRLAFRLPLASSQISKGRGDTGYRLHAKLSFSNTMFSTTSSAVGASIKEGPHMSGWPSLRQLRKEDSRDP